MVRPVLIVLEKEVVLARYRSESLDLKDGLADLLQQEERMDYSLEDDCQCLKLMLVAYPLAKRYSRYQRLYQPRTNLDKS